MRIAAFGLFAAILLTLAPACGPSEVDCADAVSALAAATSGDTVTLGACEVAGPLVVPPGVTLEGSGLLSTSVTGASDTAVVALGAMAQLRSLTVIVDSGIGVSIGTGAIVQGVEVRGNGLAACGPAEDGSSDGPATRGIVCDGAADVRITDTTVCGFAQFGAIFRACTNTSWTGGAIGPTRYTGLIVSGGDASFDALSITNVEQGPSATPAYGAVFAAGATVTATTLQVSGSDAYGMLQDGANTTFTSVDVRDNGEAGLWAQNGGQVTINSPGAPSEFVGNGLGGVVLVEVGRADIQATRMEATRSLTMITPELGSVEVGDGIHMIGMDTAALTLSDLELTGNERAGLLLNVTSDAVTAGVFENVTVTANGSANGAVAQGPGGLITSPGWDIGIDRQGAALANDGSLTSPLDVVGIVMPMFLPAP